jgi:predicted HTH transcriptional regulator
MTEEDLQRLIEDAVTEGRRVDFKISLPGPTDADKREFLADVTSFANSSGGQLYFGIREEGGFPVELVGLDIENLDDAIQRLENLTRDGIEPRLPSLRIESVTLSSSSKPIVVLDIGRSWALPHAARLR